jgi:hypothetical protein
MVTDSEGSVTLKLRDQSIGAPIVKKDLVRLLLALDNYFLGFTFNTKALSLF